MYGRSGGTMSIDERLASWGANAHVEYTVVGLPKFSTQRPDPYWPDWEAW